MCSTSSALPVKTNEIINNATAGNYRPKFFDLPEFNLSRVEFNSLFFEEQNIEEVLLRGNYSFAYLREDKLRTIHAYDSEDKIIDKNDFCSRLGIKIISHNLFKTSKYLSRIFRPVKYGGYFTNLNTHINANEAFQNKCTDGISLISISLAHTLGWKDAVIGKSAQFTLFSSLGLVKGHCLVSELTKADVIVFPNNIKDEVKFEMDYTYIAIEPVKLSSSVKIDIQSLLNLWNLFGEEQYFSWARKGIEKYKYDLISGRLTELLDDFENISPREYEKESWTLKKAIWHKIDYTRFPGLMRLGWQMFRKSILNYSDRKGSPVFRIPIPSAYRAYLRCDLRNHDSEGNFTSTVPSESMHLDKYGNIWFSKDDADEYLTILGGADLDDSVVIIPIQDGKAVIYRNPNQYGEYLIVSLTHDEEIIFDEVNKVIGCIPQKGMIKDKSSRAKCDFVSNPLITQYLCERKNEVELMEFTQTNLLKTYAKISNNTANIGVVANAEMIRSSIGIANSNKQKQLTKLYPWNLERVIDSVVKDGINCSEDLYAVENMYQHIFDINISLPNTLIRRLPQNKQQHAVIASKHKLDLLYEAVNYLIVQADKDVLGEGSASRNNRIHGMLDRCIIPLVEIGLSNLDNPMNECAHSMASIYNRKIGILLGTTADLPVGERENVRSMEIEIIQRHFLHELNGFPRDEMREIVKSLAYNIYKSESFVHDSILWISNKDGLVGTAELMIEMLANVEVAAHIKNNGCVTRYFEKRDCDVQTRVIRVWSKEKLNASQFIGCAEILISGYKVLLGDALLNLGEEVKIEEGVFSIRNIVQSISKKNNSKLSNSITLYLA